MNKYIYWSFLLSGISSLSGFTASAIREQVALAEFSDPVAGNKLVDTTLVDVQAKLADLDRLNNLDNLDRLDSLSITPEDPERELIAIASTSLVTATLDGQLEPTTLEPEIIEIAEIVPAPEPPPPPQKPAPSLRNIPKPQLSFKSASSPLPAIKPAPQTVALVKEFEGFRANAYIDTDGTPVIGYGQSRVNGRKVKLGDRISPQIANQSLQKELGIIQQEILSVLEVEVTPNQLGAITSLAYNAGVHGVKQSTLVRKLNSRDYLGAANEFTRWDKGNLRGRIVRMPGLTRRRQRERQMFLTSQNPTITAFNQPEESNPSKK